MATPDCRQGKASSTDRTNEQNEGWTLFFRAKMTFHERERKKIEFITRNNSLDPIARSVVRDRISVADWQINETLALSPSVQAGSPPVQKSFFERRLSRSPKAFLDLRVTHDADRPAFLLFDQAVQKIEMPVFSGGRERESVADR